MRGKSLALLILALGCGLVASLGITQVLARRGEPAPASNTTPVCIAKTDVPLGAVLTADYLKVEQWPKDKIPANALAQQAEVEGRRARYKIFAGQPVLEPMLLRHGESSANGLIPKGLRVVAIPVGAEAIHSGLVSPGSRCDIQVFIQANATMEIADSVTKTILQDIRVFAVNDVTSTEPEDPKAPNTARSFSGGKTVSLLVTPEQAEQVTLASKLGEIRLVLRSADDSDQPKIAPAEARQLLGLSGGANRKKEGPEGLDADAFNGFVKRMHDTLAKDTTTPAKPAKVEKPEEFTMRVRSGADVSDVRMIANSASRGVSEWTTSNMPLWTAPETPAAAKSAEAGAASTADPVSPAKPRNGSPPPLPKASPMSAASS